MSDSNDTIDVQRRRQGASGGPQGRRADTPSRQRPGSGGPTGSGGSGGSGGGGGYGSSGGGQGLRLPLWMLIPLVICFLIYAVFFSGNNTSQVADTPAAVDNQSTVSGVEAVEPPTQAPVARHTATSASQSSGQAAAPGGAKKWTVMLYEDADDQILEEDMYLDLNEAERAGSTDQVNIIAQMDRFKGAFKGDGNWTGARRYYIRQDSDLEAIHSDMVGDLGEVNMADGATLVDFVTWAMKTYPAQHYALVLSDHGMGWPGGWSDGDSGGSGTSSKIPLVSRLDDNLYLMELDSALKTIQAQTGVDKLDLLGMDACLMSNLEAYTMLQPYARYAVASEETEPALGWAYTSFLKGLIENPQMDGAELGKLIVQGYIRDDQRIVDDQARSDFLRQGSPFGGMLGGGQPNAAQLASQMSSDITLTAVDLQALPGLLQSVNNLSVALQDEDQSAVANSREYAQSFTNIFGKGRGPYIDLGSFVQMLAREGSNQKVAQIAQQVLGAEKQAIVAEKHGTSKKGASGFSIYFPNSTLYSSPLSGPQSYTSVAQAFARQSLWDDFLAYHYTDRRIDPKSNQAIVPSGGGATRAPGAGTISISPVTISSKTAAPGKPVTLSAQIKGQNIGYIYLFVGYYDSAANSIFVVDSDYLQSPDTRERDGLYYPVWQQNKTFTMRLKWEPTVFAVSDGQEEEAVALNPQTYGADPTEAIYTLDGTFTYAQDGQSRPARLYFRNGELQHVYGFAGQVGAGSPAEIIPQAGDTFTIQETWMDLDTSGKVTATTTQDGKTLTFGDQMFKWQEIYAAPGNYVIGFIVQDLDGNTTQAYTQVQVK